MADPLPNCPRHAYYSHGTAARYLLAATLLALSLLSIPLHAQQRWERSRQGLSDGNIVAIVPGDHGDLYALRYTWPCRNLWDEKLYTIFLSTDHGASWSLVRDSVSDGCFQYNSAGLFVEVPEKVLTGNGTMRENVLIRSTDRGATWQEVPGGAQSGILVSNRNGTLVAISCLSVNDTTLQAHLTISSDNGKSWTSRRNPFGWIYSAAVEADGAILLSAYTSATMDPPSTALYRSTDQGVSWNVVREKTTAWQIAASATNANEIFAAVNDPTSTSPGDLIRSTDGGTTWSMALAGKATRTIILGHDGLVVANDGNSSVRSTDHGTTWKLIATVGTTIPGGDGELFAVSLGFATHSTDYGTTWRDITDGLDKYDLQCLGRDADGNVCAGSAEHGVYRLSTNGSAGVASSSAGAGSVDCSLDLPWPNPFEESSTISYALAHPAEIHLGIYDPVGGEVRRLAEGWMPAGAHHVSIGRDGLAPGVYFIRLSVEGRTLTRSLTVH